MALLMSSIVFYSCIAPASAIEFNQYEKVRNTELFKVQIWGGRHGLFLGEHRAKSEKAASALLSA
jgi:hypothetical protein